MHPLLPHHPATTDIYTLSLHDALPILGLIIETLTHLALAVTTSPWVASVIFFVFGAHAFIWGTTSITVRQRADRKSTRLNSSHITISYAVFCLKKKIDSNADRDTVHID